jgi:AAA15 family ATPase/GTPase
MLKKIKITNFLSCQDTEIEFDNITALIGRNAAGKTNILKTIEWCAQFAVGNVPDDFIYGAEGLYAAISIEFLIENKTYKYKRYNEVKADFDFIFVEQLSYSLNNEWILIAERKNDKVKHYNLNPTEFEISSDAPMISSTIALLSQKIINPEIKVISSYLSKIKYYDLDEDKAKSIDYFISDNVYKEWLKDNKEKISIPMRLIHIWNEEKELFNELQELLGVNGLSLINAINIIKNKFPTLSSNPKVVYIISFDIVNTEVNYIQLSYGTRRVLAILLALLYDKNSTLLIEQPEDGIHSGLLKKLLPLCFQYAKYYNKQLIIATHSSEVINLFQPENIRLVKMTENGTKVSALDKERMPFIHEFIENEGALFDLIDAMDDE